jgi:hypothetical protein
MINYTKADMLRFGTVDDRRPKGIVRDDLAKRAAGKDKHMHIVEGSNHMKHYDVPKYVDEVVSVLGPFFTKHLTKASAIAAK